MIVYANHLSVEGTGAEAAAFRAIGRWLNEKLHFSFQPTQITSDGRYRGKGAQTSSTLRIRACYEGDPALCSWVLRHPDSEVHGRQWLVELGVKRAATFNISCVVKTEEQSTLVADPVSASQPRVIQYLVENVRSAEDASFDSATAGTGLRRIGENSDSYTSFLEEVKWPDRRAAVVLVSAAEDGNYLLDPSELQRTLIGLAQVVRVVPEANTYEMERVLGPEWSAWKGAVNILSTPSHFGRVRSRRFLHDHVQAQNDREAISEILSWVTANTNSSRLGEHVRPHGVALQAARRRLARDLKARSKMSEDELRQSLSTARETVADQENDLLELLDENSRLEAELSQYREELRSTNDRRRQLAYQLSQQQMVETVGGNGSGLDHAGLVGLIGRADPSPLECLKAIRTFYSTECTILDTAWKSAEDAGNFAKGKRLFDQLHRLMSDYRSILIGGGSDHKAMKEVFAANEFAATESDKIMNSKKARRQRTFEYDGKQVEMLRHLKIGIADDPARTIRTHFHWDPTRQRIVIGHCGRHLFVPDHK